jgi:hypothetical protein
MAINARISEVMSNYNSSVTSGIATPSSDSDISSPIKGKAAVSEAAKASSPISDVPAPEAKGPAPSPGASPAPSGEIPQSPEQVKYTPSQYPREEAYVPPPDAGTGENEKVIESFSCAIYPKRGMLTHGRYVLEIVYFYVPHVMIKVPCQYLNVGCTSSESICCFLDGRSVKLTFRCILSPTSRR